MYAAPGGGDVRGEPDGGDGDVGAPDVRALHARLAQPPHRHDGDEPRVLPLPLRLHRQAGRQAAYCTGGHHLVHHPVYRLWCSPRHPPRVNLRSVSWMTQHDAAGMIEPALPSAWSRGGGPTRARHCSGARRCCTWWTSPGRSARSPRSPRACASRRPPPSTSPSPPWATSSRQGRARVDSCARHVIKPGYTVL